jgi:hypothetical protein
VTGRAARVLLLRFRALPSAAQNTIIAGMRTNFESRSQTLQVRVLAYDTGAGVDFLGLVEARAALSAEINFEAFGEYRNALDLVNTYTPYT